MALHNDARIVFDDFVTNLCHEPLNYEFQIDAVDGSIIVFKDEEYMGGLEDLIRTGINLQAEENEYYKSAERHGI